jgi:hypothetical protein
VSLDSSVGIATGYWLDSRGSSPGKSKKFLSSPQRPDRLRRLSGLLSDGFWGAFSPGSKRPGREDDSSLPFCAVKNNPLRHMYSWSAIYLIFHKINVTFM